MASTESLSPPVTVKNLRGLSRAIFSQQEGWQAGDESSIYTSSGDMGTLMARTNPSVGANGLSLDLTTPDSRRLSVSYSVPDFAIDETAKLVAWREEADGQLSMTYGTEANQIFWAIQQAFIKNQATKQR